MFDQSDQRVGKQVNLGNQSKIFGQRGQVVGVGINIQSEEKFPEVLPEGLKLVESRQLPSSEWIVAAPLGAEATFYPEKHRANIVSGSDTIFLVDDEELHMVRGSDTTGAYIIGYRGKKIVETSQSTDPKDINVQF